MNTLQDTSIFQGWKQFTDRQGYTYRAEYQGCNIWHLYIESGANFVFDRIVQCPKHATCLQIYESME